MDGNLRRRELVRDDLTKRVSVEPERRHRELHPKASGHSPGELGGLEQVNYWRDRQEVPSFVYFIQHGDIGPVKIGRSVDLRGAFPSFRQATRVRSTSGT
jgi:hypothetical protein